VQRPRDAGRLYEGRTVSLQCEKAESFDEDPVLQQLLHSSVTLMVATGPAAVQVMLGAELGCGTLH